MGVQAEVKIRAWGWYPRGGGELELRVMGNGGGAASLKSLHLLERGALQQVKGLAIVTELPSHIPQRMANRAQNLLSQAHLKAQVQPNTGSGGSDQVRAFFSLPSMSTAAQALVLWEKLDCQPLQVAAITTKELLNFHANGAPIDIYLADQLLLPAALASFVSQYRSAGISTHLTTNAWVIEQFGLAKTVINAVDKLITVTPLG